MHGLGTLVVTAPVIQSIQLLGLAFLAATLVDGDRFLPARSRSFWTATYLEVNHLRTV